jgi:hypothetical protein
MIGIPLKYNTKNEEIVKALAVPWKICLPSNGYTYPKPSVACLSSHQSKQPITTVLEKDYIQPYLLSILEHVSLWAISDI